MKRNQRETEEQNRRLTRRTLLLGGAQAAFMAVLAARMRFMQVDQADQYTLLAEENRVNIRLLPPSRGRITDRKGKVLADNEQIYRVTLVKEDAGDVDAVLARLGQLIPLDPVRLAKAREEIDKLSPFVPVTVAERITWEEFSRVASNAPALPGVTPEVGQSRIYPMGKDFAHVVGYVGPVSDYDLSKIEDPDPLLLIPKFQIGKLGIEAKLEEALRGSAGFKQLEVNAVGRVMRELSREEGDPGATLELTIDADLQCYMEARLGGESAAAVVMDVTNGDVLGIASAPSFDPNAFVRGISSADYKALTEDIYRPLADKTVQGIYPPGSTFKMVTALAALEAGVISPEETVYCPGHLDRSGRKFHCWKRSGHGDMNLIDSLGESCDVYYYDVAERATIDRIADMARRLGLGTKHDLPMSAINEGLVPSREWKKQNRKQDWLVGDTLNSGIGQGFVLASPLQLAVMTARIATGLAVEPRLVRAVNGKPKATPQPASLEISEEYLRVIRRGMNSVINARRGTAYSARIEDETNQMAGKTGTSQVRNISTTERAEGVTANNDLPWEMRDHALFVSYAPVENPRLACVVVVEHGGGGSATAAPIARDIMLQALYDGPPPLEAYPANQRGEARERQKELTRVIEEALSAPVASRT
jgi:penicillin-binding protein 2